MKKSTLCLGLAISNHLSSSVDAGVEGFGWRRAEWSNRKVPSLSKRSSTVIQASASHTTLPRGEADTASDIDDDFDPNFIHNILRDQGVIPASTSIATGSTGSTMDEPELPPGPPGSAYQEMDDENSPTTDHEPPPTHGGQRLPHSPVIYRYYGKSRSRTRSSGSIPFILLGPDIDHWRTTGEHLAARGFSVIACERDPFEPESDEEDISQKTDMPWHTKDEWWKGTDDEGANLILNVLQVSRWSKAILVACDSEAVIAIQAVMALAPEKIAGVVLCGDLREVDALLLQSHPDLSRQEGDFAIDAFLRGLLPCPFAIAWDGETITDMPALATPSEYDGSSPAECLTGHRCLILGGGIAPHRRQPETFSWALTRFVEDKVAPSVPFSERKKLFDKVRQVDKNKNNGDHISAVLSGVKSSFSSSFISGDYFSTGSFVVYGRILASALLYASMLKVGIFQYSNFLEGMVNMKSRYDGVQRIKRKAVGGIASFFVNFGYIPLLFKRSGSGGESLLESTDDKGPEESDIQDAKEDEVINDDEKNDTPGDSLEEEEDESLDEKLSDEREEDRYRFQPLFFLDNVVA